MKAFLSLQKYIDKNEHTYWKVSVLANMLAMTGMWKEHVTYT